MQGINQRSQVAHLAVNAGVLHQGGKAVVVLQVLGQLSGMDHVDRDAQRLGTGLDHFERLGQHVMADHKTHALGLARAGRQCHGFGC